MRKPCGIVTILLDGIASGEIAIRFAASPGAESRLPVFDSAVLSRNLMGTVEEGGTGSFGEG